MFPFKKNEKFKCPFKNKEKSLMYPYKNNKISPLTSTEIIMKNLNPLSDI